MLTLTVPFRDARFLRPASRCSRLEAHRVTPLPAVLMLTVLPVFALLPARHSRTFLSCFGIMLLVLIGGPILAGGIRLAAMAVGVCYS